jgi:hypothetical protein
MVLYWFFYSLLNQMSSDSPGDPYQKEHKLVDKCIEKQQVHPDVVQPEIIAGSYRPLIFIFIVVSYFLFIKLFRIFNHSIYSFQSVFNQFNYHTILFWNFKWQFYSVCIRLFVSESWIVFFVS